MRFLTDQDVYELTVVWLRARGHEVLRARDIGLSRASDETILRMAAEEHRVLVTRDKDFGALTFLDRRVSHGVVLLRVLPESVAAVHEEFGRFLEEHQGQNLEGAFVVVEPGRHRIRRM